MNALSKAALTMGVFAATACSPEQVPSQSALTVKLMNDNKTQVVTRSLLGEHFRLQPSKGQTPLTAYSLRHK